MSLGPPSCLFHLRTSTTPTRGCFLLLVLLFLFYNHDIPRQTCSLRRRLSVSLLWVSPSRFDLLFIFTLPDLSWPRYVITTDRLRISFNFFEFSRMSFVTRISLPNPSWKFSCVYLLPRHEHGRTLHDTPKLLTLSLAITLAFILQLKSSFSIKSIVLPFGVKIFSISEDNNGSNTVHKCTTARRQAVEDFKFLAEISRTTDVHKLREPQTTKPAVKAEYC
jgi:hypothetical protein